MLKLYACSADLTAAFERYKMHFFPHRASTDRSRVRSSVVLNQVTVTVADLNVPLQLESDESYKLSISSGGILIVSQTVYGAYHAMETLSQLIVFNFDSQASSPFPRYS